MNGEKFIKFVWAIVLAAIEGAVVAWHRLATFSEAIDSIVIGCAVIGLLLGAGLGLLLVPENLKTFHASLATVIAHAGVAMIGIVGYWGFTEIIDGDMDFAGRMLVIGLAVGVTSTVLSYLASVITLTLGARKFA